MLAIAAAVLLTATPCAAQDARTEAIRARIDSLSVAFLAADAAWDSATEAARLERRHSSGAEPDTQRVGIVTVVSAPRSAGAARTATNDALLRFGELGRSVESPLAGLTLLVEGTRGLPEANARSVRVWLPPFTSARRRADAVASALRARLAEELPADARQWLGTGLAARVDEEQMGRLYRTMLLARDRSARGCLAGDVALCTRALGLDGDRTGTLDADARQSLLAHALEDSGIPGYERIAMDSAEPLIDRFAAAAGSSPDALVAGWRERVVAARPERTAGLAVTGLATILWAAALSALAMRSTRWRLG